MPIKRSAVVLHLNDVSFWERFYFLAGCWRPGHEATRWKTWAEYLAAYECVRAELLAEQGHWLPFAEHVRAGMNPAEARAAYDADVAAYSSRRRHGGSTQEQEHTH